jgi:hypothetical protein
MKKSLTIVVLTLAMLGTGFAAVVRLAPDFSWQGQGAGSKRTTLRSLRGQPVVLLIAKSAKDHTFRKQARRLKEIYQEFAGRNVVFVAALLDASGIMPSDVPIVVANDGAKIAADYGAQGSFGVVVIGTDGNVDMQTSKLVPASRIKDVIINSYPAQAQERKKNL